MAGGVGAGVFVVVVAPDVPAWVVFVAGGELPPEEPPDDPEPPLPDELVRGVETLSDALLADSRWRLSPG